MMLYLQDLYPKGGVDVVLANVLIIAKTGKAEDIIKAVEKIEMVTKTNMVTGPFDIIAYADLPSRVDFRKLINSLHEIDELTKTETCVAL
jgi:hypothetical protein